MSNQAIQLEPGNYYHLYNHGVGGRDLFKNPDNYEYFLALYEKYISPIADTFAWVLMPNHFHLLIRIKDEAEIIENSDINKPLHQYFSNLFNAYSKAFNKRYGVRGALFERPFKRKQVDSVEYLKQVILYIHNNPVHHGFCSHPVEYPWSSYLSCVSVKPTRLQRQSVIGWFVSDADFRYMHHGKVEVETIETWLEL